VLYYLKQTHALSVQVEKVESLEIAPVRRIEGTVKLPGSKSLSNRILLLAALAEGTTSVQNLLVSVLHRAAGHGCAVLQGHACQQNGGATRR
jgi:5-enolpyruvylshikimate-3-phosphate synthase